MLGALTRKNQGYLSDEWPTVNGVESVPEGAREFFLAEPRASPKAPLLG
jgi:hypothetical protein